MNRPSPALVTERAAQRLPRLALLLFCAAYVLPGLFGRDPWRNADIAAFGFMQRIATGATGLLSPAMGGLGAEDGLFPYWLGALFIRLLGGLLDPALAARLPFALLLAGVLMLTWYACYHLARTDAAQPVAFAFGGEPAPADYARAVADGSVLALIATLGLLQLGHETTPELLQLFGTAMFLYALAASPFRGGKSRVAVLLALPLLAGSGAPAIAQALGAVGLIVCLRSSYTPAQRFVPWVLAAMVLAALLATVVDLWRWQLAAPEARRFVRLLLWFIWPAWVLAVWTLWRWRHHLLQRHIAVPWTLAAVAIVSSALSGGSDRALLLALPPLAVLAAFALPTLRRSVASAVDWFSVFFFSVCALAIWVIYLAMQTGVPAKPAANVARLLPGFEPSFSVLALLLAALGTLAWLALVGWRAGRHREALWRSLVLPAGGVALCWLLLMTLWLPALDYARSYRALVERLAAHVPSGACVQTRGLSLGQIAALEYHGGWQVHAGSSAVPEHCPYLMVLGRAGRVPQPGERWTLVGRERRPAERNEFTYVFRRAGEAAPR
ncbi:hypothetical protein [Caldimonas tepidiphila]|uniref:hypothetical protein n=1 Tax=Caldimonas tepidiphila TaxID=2315841 RepID=UPI000E5AECCB|nr:hypothetical protein [Caldimonas tepidiphila]